MTPTAALKHTTLLSIEDKSMADDPSWHKRQMLGDTRHLMNLASRTFLEHWNHAFSPTLLNPSLRHFSFIWKE